jgi:hypothetical protein
MEFIAYFLFYAACYAAVVAVHESGHFLAGWAGGIPARDMRIRLFSFPQHVVLRSADRWVSPASIDEYVELVWRYLKTAPKVYAYVVGGFFMETVVTTVLGFALVRLGLPRVAIALVGMSLFLVTFWLVVDAITIWRGRVAGDFSGLWAIARIPTAILALVFVALHGVALWYAAT